MTSRLPDEKYRDLLREELKKSDGQERRRRKRQTGAGDARSSEIETEGEDTSKKQLERGSKRLKKEHEAGLHVPNVVKVETPGLGGPIGRRTPLLGPSSRWQKARNQVSNAIVVDSESDETGKKRPEIVDLSSGKEHESDSDDFEDVDLSGSKINNNNRVNNGLKKEPASRFHLGAASGELNVSHNFVSSNTHTPEPASDDEFEDVDLDGSHVLQFPEPSLPEQSSETFTISISRPEEKAKTRKVVLISKQERDQRKAMHQYCIALMLVHGAIRNRWCNDYKLSLSLKRLVSPNTLALLFQSDNDNVLTTVKSRRFLDGLNVLLRTFSTRFRVSGEGIKRKNWNELGIRQPRRIKGVTFEKFTSLISGLRGSRDIAAQGFVALLRSIGLNARLVFSLQPPDFTIMAALPILDKNGAEPGNKMPSKEEEPKPSNGLNYKQNLLASLRSRSATVIAENVPILEDSMYPIFWAEVWNKHSKKWVSIDPVVLKLIESAPMRNKSKFEPPQNDMRNQLYYVVAYDRFGGVKDVTRRYSQFYNAKVAKKRISYKSEEDQFWYDRLLKSASSSLRQKTTKLDILESKEFYDRDLAEGMPNNIADYNNHPIYALESQLKQNEVIYPMDSTSKCGTFRAKISSRSNKSKSGVINVYKRSHVHLVRSAKAWHMRGRVLKMGVQPLKLKKKSAFQKKNEAGSEGDEEEETVRLYAEFQTQLFKQQPIIDGIVPKNAYGNIDVYTPSMMPENGVLIDTTGVYTMKMAEYAARGILEIDYARAIIAFDFGRQAQGLKQKSGRTPTAREGGIVIDKQYEEAILAVLEALAEEEDQKEKDKVKMNSLKFWKFFLTKLRISERLNRNHGKIEKVEKEKKSKKEDYSEDSDDYSVYETSGNEVEDMERDDSEQSEQLDPGGGFMLEEGGFTRADSDSGGFVMSPKKRPPSDSEDDESDEYNFGGGFLSQEPMVAQNPTVHVPTPRLSVLEDQSDEYEDDAFSVETANHPEQEFIDEDFDIPDELFTTNENGELVYNAQETPQESVQEEADSGLNLEGAASEKSCGSESERLEEVDADPGKSSPETVPESSEVSEPDEPLMDSQEQEQVLTEESNFGFQYSDSE